MEVSRDVDCLVKVAVVVIEYVVVVGMVVWRS